MTITDHTTSPETVQFLEFSYDASGQPLTVTLDGTLYFYVLNVQGDVMGIVDGSGNLQFSFVYEGYGEGYYYPGASGTNTTLVNANPLGYRGYVMDIGTGLYYLQSRYYDPTLGRFLNADVFASTGQGLLGNNMFAYCGNNPINNSDPSGRAFFKNARELLKLWLDGTGEDQQYEQQDSLTRRIRNSDKMKEIVSNAIEQYKNGVDPSEWDSGQVTFYADDDQDLFLAARTCSYSIDITTQKKTTGAWFWKKEKEQIVVTVTVYDLYDFTPQAWDSFGNTINNIAWIFHVVLDVGEDYWWYATYTQKTRWETVS